MRNLTADDVEGRGFVIGEVVELWVESDFYTQESQEIRVSSFSLEKFGDMQMDIQLEFASPSSITQSVSTPDILHLRFKTAWIFVDKVDYTEIASDTELEYELPPQLS